MKISLRMVLVALVAVVAIGGLISAVPGGEKNSSNTLADYVTHAGACNDEQGVSLVVDFGSSSTQSPMTTCVKNFKGTGWQLFSAAGIKVAGTDEFPTGFVCRIANWPSAEKQPCTSTPTNAQGTWAYFVASVSTQNQWQFSGQGAATHKPGCGSLEGWRFVEPGESASASLPRVTPMPFGCK
jgi:hypothetical protein